MSYTINGINANYPTGTFLPYGGATDPPGWVICDGVSRTNTGGIYNNLISMNIGFAGTGTWSPFNLRDCTMFGDNASTTLFSKIGSRTNTLTASQMPTHTHFNTITAHTNHIHVVSDQVMWDNTSGERPNGDGGLGDRAITKTTVGVSHGHPNTTSNATGLGTSINNLNYSYIIIWIVKI